MQPVKIGRQLQSKQTGFIHTDDTIPILENALFALSLFRTRLSDNVLEGKALIEKLLPFEVNGNFPVYLHSYPQAADPYLGLRLLPIFFWIINDFGHVIGGLKGLLEECIQRIIARAKNITSLSNWAILRLAAYEGKIDPLPRSLHEWNEGLISLQIAEKRGADITGLIKQAFKLWHPQLSLYIGPALHRNQEGYYPQVTLFDLFLSVWHKHFSLRISEPAPIHLHAALIQPLSFEPEIPELSVPFIHFNREEECPLFIAWAEDSFVLAKQHLEVQGNPKELVLHLSDSEDEMPVNFFFNYHPDHQIFVNGQKASTFSFADKLEIRSKGGLIELNFSSEDGKYMGHILRGNRPSQHACKGEDLFTAYDWRIALRTIVRGKAPILVRFQVQCWDHFSESFARIARME